MNALPHTSSISPFDLALASPNLRLRVGDHVVDLGALRVITRPQAARLTSKAAAVLIELARHAGDTVTRDQLLGCVWKDRITTPDVLTQAIKDLRRAFADDTRPARYIETIPKIGYRLIVPVDAIEVANLCPAITPVGQRFTAAVSATADFTSSRDSRNPANGDIAAYTTAPAPSARAKPPLTRASRWLMYFAGVLVLGSLAIVATTSFALWGRSTAHNWQAIDVHAVTSDPGPERRPRVSPDGTRVAYSQLDPATGFERVVVRSVDQSQIIHLSATVTASEEMPAWSPDGTQIAFERISQDHACTLYVAPSLGSTDTVIGDCGNYLANYFDWSPDGKSLITSGTISSGTISSDTISQRSSKSDLINPGLINSGLTTPGLIKTGERTSTGGSALALMLWDLSSGEKRLLQYQRSSSDQDLEARYSPNGSLIAFRRGLAPHSDLFLMRAAGGSVLQLTHISARIMGYAWTRDGRGLIFASDADGSSALYTVRLDDGHVEPLNVTSAAYPDAARVGSTVVYEIARTKTTLAEVMIGPAPEAPRLLAPSTGSDSAPAFSPDGQRIAFVSDRNGSQQIWLHERDGSQTLALTDYRGAGIWNSVWSDDGRRLLATVRIDGQTHLVEIDVASRRRRIVAKSQSALLSGSYGVQPGSYFLSRRTADARAELVMLLNADTEREQAVPIATAVEHVEIDSAAGMVYFTRSDVPGLYRRDVAGNAEQLVTTRIDSMTRDGWRVVDGRIWYVSNLLAKPFDLREFDPATGVDRPVVRVDSNLREFNFSVAPARDRVIFAPAGPEDIDVGAFDLVPNSKL